MTGMANTPAATIMSSAATITRFGAAIAKRANACSISSPEPGPDVVSEIAE
jgi:hypothetical protein